EDAEEPEVHEVNFSMFPVVNVILLGNIPERALIRIARRLRDRIEEIPMVLGVDIGGNREEQVDILLDPLMLESYGLTVDIIPRVSANNRLIAAGSLETLSGQYNVKVPGLLENIHDILTLPLKMNQDAVVAVGDIASVRKTFKDPESFARVNGSSTVVLEVKKRTGENIIETIERVRKVVAEEQQFWPEGVEVLYAQDQSKGIMDMLADLQNNILLAIILVVVVLIWVMSVRPAMFVAFSVPGAFLFGVLVIASLGLTLNIVVLFSLILSIGMLVDSAIVVSEYADKQIQKGIHPALAYPNAAKRMSWPIIASTVTTLLAFAPLLFWPGVVGQFMKYMPLTLIATLTGSLLMALIFLPTLGAMTARWFKDGKTPPKENTTPLEDFDLEASEDTALVRRYRSALENVLNHSGKFSLVLLALMVCVFILQGVFGAGVEFFPKIEPENAQVHVRARGNLSVYEKDRLMHEVESRILDMHDEIEVFYTRAGKMDSKGQETAEDVIGIIQVEFQYWSIRRPAEEILQEIRERTRDIPGIIVETKEQEEGPPVGKPFQLELASHTPEKLTPAITRILQGMQE
ncbi:MAG: efflux RND transporter permease subunit, partial [Rickettsiales bacterium]|nr:efflux RND transporter permease subunit [Rickettsiales bacterium]